MPAFGSFTVNDRTTPTPVAQLFIPVKGPDQTDTGFSWRKAGTTLLHDLRAVLVRRARASSSSVKATFDFPTVVDETINGVVVPREVRNIKIIVEMIASDESTELERNNALGIVHNSLAAANTQFHAVFVQREYTW